MLKAVIFDIDGTLLDSVDLHARAWTQALSEFGHRVSFADVRRQIGKGSDQLMPVFLSRDEIDARGEQLVEHRSRLFKERYLPKVRSFNGVRPLFERIRGEGTKIALASSASEEELHAYINIAAIGDLLDAKTSADDAENSKPCPDIFLAALRSSDGVDAADAIVIDDTPYDAQRANRAGISAAGVTCGGWYEADLLKAGCVAVYGSPADMLERFDQTVLSTSFTKAGADISAGRRTRTIQRENVP
jgi:HAD superfamily hydrolase (TIGR01509 family)